MQPELKQHDNSKAYKTATHGRNFRVFNAGVCNACNFLHSKYHPINHE